MTLKDPVGVQAPWTAALAARWRESGYWLDTTLARLTEALAREAGDREMILEGERRFSIAEILGEARRLAGALLARGLGPGSVISYQLPNWYEATVLNLAASYIGAAVNPLVPIYRDNELAFMLDDVKAQMVFVPDTFRGHAYAEMLLRVRGRLSQPLEIVVVRGGAPGCRSYGELLATGSEHPALPEVDPDSVYVMMHTSGTTGRPKCVLHSHNTFLVQGRVLTLELRATDHDVHIVGSPISHVTGMILANVAPVIGGAKVVLMERWSAEAAIELIHAHGGTIMGGAPPFFAQLLESARSRGDHLESMRVLSIGGTTVPPELVRALQAWFPNAVAFRAFGCSEVPTVSVRGGGREDIAHGAETDGKIKHAEVRIVDPVTGAPCAAGEEGEILARGPQMMLGYLRPEDNADAFDADGFFRTGDLGRIVDGDYLLVTGRKKDLIIRSGENLSPKEIEDVLHTHPAILEAACVGMPDQRTGECVCAFVVTRPGQTVTLAELDRFLQAAGLARQKVPEHLELVESLPTSPQGKVLKVDLRRRAAELAGR